MVMANTIKVPPDGGYGWVIVFANAISNLMIIPIMQSFGLIFKDTFIEMGLSATEGSLIINLNAAFGMLLGLVNGVLLKVYGFRKLALIGSVLVTIGIILTSFSRTFTQFMISYGLITSLGMGLSMSAYSLALNTYFRTKRNKAVGWAVTITGLGPILMPQLIYILTKYQTVQGATLILGAITSHSIAAAMLLQPVKWHMKYESIDSEQQEIINEKEEPVYDSPKFSRSVSRNGYSRQNSRNDNVFSDPEIEIAPVYGLDSAFGGSVISLASVIYPTRRLSVVSQTRKTKNSSANLQINNGDFNQRESVYNPQMTKPIKQETCWSQIKTFLIKYFDLDLFKDPIYINIMIGMSLAVFAELNFSILTAFILADLGLTTNQIATFMSVLGISDIIFRFLAPYIGDYLNKPARPMYLFTLFLLMSTRFCLLLSNNPTVLLVVALALGIAKGVRTVYMSLVIPSHVSLEKLPTAAGLQMMVNGLFILIGGPLLGVVRDLTGSYTWCIVIMNAITFTTVVMWTVEAIVVKLLKKKEEPAKLSEQNVLLTK